MIRLKVMPLTTRKLGLRKKQTDHLFVQRHCDMAFCIDMGLHMASLLEWIDQLTKSTKPIEPSSTS